MNYLILLVFSAYLAFSIYVDVESAEAREITPFSFHLDEQLMIGTDWSYTETGGKSASVVMKGEEVELPLKILSATTKPVNLEFHATYGAEQFGPSKMPRGVTIEVEPKNMLLKPNQDQTLKIHVKVNKNAPANKYDIQIVAQWPEPNGFVGTSFSLHAGRDFGPDSIAVNFFPAPLKQTKEGVLPTEVVCTNDYVLVFKASNNIPACVSPQNASKLVERGWTSSTKFSSVIKAATSLHPSQTLAIGTDRYDIAEFKPMAGNAVQLDDVNFTYQGNSPVYDSCYPEFTNQSEARNFEIMTFDVNMNTRQCWPPSNFPQDMTKYNTMPAELFSVYSISFFDINQTTGVGWCHSDVCDFGKMFYLVKSGWNAPIVYDDPASLEFRLITNSSTISSGQAIEIDMSTNNKLSKPVMIRHEYHYSFNGTGLRPCDLSPFSIAILEGYFGENNFTQGIQLMPYQPGRYMCPPPIPAKDYKFEPMSSSAMPRCSPFINCDGIVQMQSHVSYSGFWSDDGQFHKFNEGMYTIIAGDEWGNRSIQHFTVANLTGK